MCTSYGESQGEAFRHEAQLFGKRGELERGLFRYVEEGLDAGEAVLVMAPPERLEAVRSLAESNRITLMDMAVHGANPARIIPLLLEWLERSTAPMRVLAEPLWAGRSQAESVEVLRHEALIEAALGATRAKLVCVYEEGVLSECHRRSLERSHHAIIDADGSLRERAVEPHSVPELLGSGPPLESPCEPVERLAVTSDLRRMRRQVKASSVVSALSPAQRNDFVLALSEVATNALQYGQPPQSLRLWRRGEAVVGEVVGRGWIQDPLAGRRRPPPTAIRGRGLWIVNQLCDLVELRSHPSRTILRMHKRCDPPRTYPTGVTEDGPPTEWAFAEGSGG